MEDAKPPSHYAGSCLDSNDSFRLIVLLKGRGDEALALRLVESRLNSAPAYEALSYVWGSPSAEELRVLDVEWEDGNHAGLAITPNCHAALRRLRRPDESRTLWIDSICINQTLVAERNHQLRLMTRIYREASRVVVYLGEASGDSDTAMDTIREFAEPSDYGERDWATDITPERIETVEALFRRPWFHRVWILQEIAIAKDAIVICGDQVVSWENFRIFYHHDPRGEGPCREKARVVPYPLEFSAKLSNRRLTHLRPFEHRLLSMLKTTRSSGATDPRDKVYALVPLLEWERQIVRENTEEISADADAEHLSAATPIRLDYGRSVAEVYTDVALLFLNWIGLQTLELVSGPPMRNQLPSWVPDWGDTRSSKFWNSRATLIRYSGMAGYYAGFPTRPKVDWLSRHRPIIQSSVPPPTWRVAESAGESSPRELCVTAFRVGRVVKLGQACDIKANTFPIEQWASLVPYPEFHKTHPTEDVKLPKFLRVLAGDDRVDHGDTILEAARRICHYNRTYSQTPQDVDRSIMLWDQEDKTEQDGEQSHEVGPALANLFDHLGTTQRYRCQRLLEYSDGGRFYVLDTGYVGIATKDAVVNDLVYVITGARVPFVFRKSLAISGDDAAKAVDYLELVGQAYVHGLMRGQIFNDEIDGPQKSLGIREEQLRIR